MWTFEQALDHIRETKIETTNQAFGREYDISTDLSEEWENGWIIYLSPVNSSGNNLRFVVDKIQKKSVFVGTRGVQRAIEECMENRETNEN